MVEPVQTFEFAKANLTDRLAKQVQDASKPLINDNSRTRRWIGIPAARKDECLNYLRSILTVQDPLIEREKNPGLFRVIDVHSEADIQVGNAPGSCDIVQVLKKGWIKTIDTDASKWTEAKWIKHDMSQQIGNTKGDSERYLHVIFRDVSPQHLGAIAVTLNVASFTNPVIFGETVTGTFRNLGVAPRTEPDGSGVVEIVMGDPDFQLTAFTNLGTPKENEVIYLYGVPKDLTPGIIAVYKALGVKGSAVTTNYYRDQHLVDLIFRQRVPGKKVEVTGIITGWNCRYKSTEDQHYGLTEAEADALVLTEPPDGEDWKSDKRFNQEDGTWTVFIEKKQTQYRDVPFQVSRIAADSTEQTRQQLGLTTQTAEPMTSVDGEVKTQRVAVRDDCSNDVTTNKDKVTNVQKVSYEKNALVNAEITDNSAAAAVLPDETPAAGTRVSISNVKTEYPAKTKTRRTVETVEDLDKKSYDHNGFIKTTITEHPAAVADEAEPAPAVGEAIQVVNDPTPFKDRTKTKKATEVAQAIDIAEHAIHFGEKETIYETEGIHDHTQPVITDPGDHSSLTLIANLDKYLTWNWRKRRSVRTFPVDDGVGWNEYGDLEAVSLQEMSMFLSPNRNYVSKVYIYQVVYIHTINYYDNASDAAGHAFIAGTTVLPNDPNANGFSSGLKTQYEDNSRSRIYHSGENEWQAHRITITKSLRYTYCYDEPVE